MKNDEWRLLDLELPNYAAIVPMLSTLLKLKSEEKIPNTLALTTYSKPSACLFYYNDPDKELDLQFCNQNDIKIGRRDTGGSPYWADPGTLLVFLWFNRTQVAGFPDTLAGAYRLLISAEAEAISERFKIPAVYRPLNDLEVEGRKVAGHTITFLGNSCRAAFGPQILRPQLGRMSRALKVPPEKFADKTAKSMEERITNLEDLLGRAPSFEEVKQTYITALEKTLNVKFTLGNLSSEEQEIIKKQTVTGSSKAWLMAMTEKRKFGVKIPSNWDRGEYTLKVSQGPLIRATVLMEGDIIRNISLTGSIHCIPVQLVEEMEAKVKGLKAKEQNVREVIEEFFMRPGVQVPNCSPDDFVQAIITAISRRKSIASLTSG